MNSIIYVFIIVCFVVVVSSKVEKKASFIIRALIDRKSYSIPLKTKFILKCSSTKFGSNEIRNADDLNEQSSDDDHPELIVINNLEQTKKLVNYFSRTNEKTNSRIDLVGWNRTSLDRIYKAKKNTKDKIKDKKSDKMYENLYLSGKGFFQPNEDVSLFAEGQSCLLFTGFAKKDESIYSCFYKPKFDWSSLFDLSSWSLSMKAFVESNVNQQADSNDDLNDNFKNIEQLMNDNKKLKDSNSMPFIEKLLYLTCTYTWPFNQECYLVKQFKLTLQEDSDEDKNQQEYWSNLNSHDRFKFKKLLKELMKYCHHSTSSSKLQQKYGNQMFNQLKDDQSKEYQSKNRNEPYSKDRHTKDRHSKDYHSKDQQFKEYHQNSNDRKDQKSNGLINEFFKHLFNDLFISVFCDLISNILNNLFNFLFGDLFNSFISSLFSSTISELFNELIKDLIDPFKDLNFFHIIYILLFILIYFSTTNKQKTKSSKTRRVVHDDQSDSQIESEKESNIKIDAYIDARIENDNHKDSNNKFKPQSKKAIQKEARKRDKNLKFNIEANVTNKTKNKAKRDISKKDAVFKKDAFLRKDPFKNVQDHLRKYRFNSSEKKDTSSDNTSQKDTSREDHFENDDYKKPIAIVSIPKCNDDDDDDYNKKFKSLIKAKNKLGDLIKKPMDQNRDQYNDMHEDDHKDRYKDGNEDDHKNDNEGDLKNQPIEATNDQQTTLDQNLEFKGEIIISKLGEVSYLGQFLFNLPKELEEKPLHLILDTSDSKDLNEITITNQKLNNENSNQIVETSLSNDLGLEGVDKQNN